ncbi:MAG: FAD-binding protein, partial [Clostridiales bacterium]
MYKQALGKKLQSLVREPVLFNEPMRKHTTWKIGGPADYFLCPSSIDELRNVLLLCQEENIPFFVMGNGSNILVGDNGILGLVIKMGDKFANCHWKQDGVDVESGAMLPYLALEAVKQGFGGLEFAAGIPGSIGGAIR